MGATVCISPQSASKHVVIHCEARYTAEYRFESVYQIGKGAAGIPELEDVLIQRPRMSTKESIYS
jgi:hypothetical protein